MEGLTERYSSCQTLPSSLTTSIIGRCLLWGDQNKWNRGVYAGRRPAPDSTLAFQPLLAFCRHNGMGVSAPAPHPPPARKG
jgi:hypothetical protein